MTTAVRNLSLALLVASTASTVVVLTLLAYGLVLYDLSVRAALLPARSGPLLAGQRYGPCRAARMSRVFQP